MKKCKYCQTEIDDKAKVCPNCRKKQGLGFWKIAGIIIGVFIVIGIIGSMGNTTTPTSNNSVVNVNQQQEKFTLLKSSSTNDGFAFYINGEIQNNTNKNYTYVQVVFNLYDKDENHLGTALANTNNLEGNKKWIFRAMGMITDNNKIASYKLSEITEY
jgi:flagellar basal body-associated protein FliL